MNCWDNTNLGKQYVIYGTANKYCGQEYSTHNVVYAAQGSGVYKKECTYVGGLKEENNIVSVISRGKDPVIGE